MSTQIVERMAAEIAGSGEPVVLIHGLGGTSNVWTPVLPAFAARARVVRFDLPGSGRSPAGGPISIQAFVDRIARAMRVLGTERAHVGGHSLGLQVVRVRTRRGFVVLASDATHFYAHIEQKRVFPIVADVPAVLAGYETLNRLASSPAHVIPGHDPLVLARYPASAPGLEGIAARLDAEPLT